MAKSKKKATKATGAAAEAAALTSAPVSAAGLAITPLLEMWADLFGISLADMLARAARVAERYPDLDTASEEFQNIVFAAMGRPQLLAAADKLAADLKVVFSKGKGPTGHSNTSLA